MTAAGPLRPLSARNPGVTRLARLAGNRDARAAEGVCVVEGPTLLAEALDAGMAVREVYVSTDRYRDTALADLVARAVEAGAESFSLDAAVLRRVADTVTPQGVLAVVGLRPVPRTLLHTVDLALVLAGVADPGNAGTLIRAAEAAGAQAVVATEGTVDLFSPKTVRASAGAVFHVPLVVGGSARAVLEDAGAVGLTRVASRLADAEPYDDVDLSGRTALVVGNEAHGLGPELDGVVDHWVTIPMAGRAESLNVAMAGSILSFEVLRQRRAAARRGNRLDPAAIGGEGSPAP